MVNDGKKFNILYLHNESIMGGTNNGGRSDGLFFQGGVFVKMVYQ